RPCLVRRRRGELRTHVLRMRALRAAFLHRAVLGKHAVHRALRAQVLPLVEQRVERLRGRSIDEAFATQRFDDARLLLIGELARRTRPRRSPRRRPAPSLHCRPRHAECLAQRLDRQAASLLKHRVHESLPSSSRVFSGIPSNVETFFWTSMIVSACSRRFSSRVTSRMRRRFSWITSLSGRPLRPRFFAASASSSPRARCLRHALRCDAYSPSRRSSSPMPPVWAKASASRRTRSLYCAVNRRRFAFAVTSVSECFNVPLSPSAVRIIHRILSAPSP